MGAARSKASMASAQLGSKSAYADAMAAKPFRSQELLRRVYRRIHPGLGDVRCGERPLFSDLWRFIQGLFCGGLLATGQSVLRDTFPPEKLGASQGIFALGAIMGPALGPPLGGILVDNNSWNWCSDINVVQGILSAVVLFALLRDPAQPRKSPVDLVGLSLLTVGLGTMQYVLTEGERHYWFSDPTIVVTTVLCVGSLVGLIVWELFGTRNPHRSARARQPQRFRGVFACACARRGHLRVDLHATAAFARAARLYADVERWIVPVARGPDRC